MEHDAASLEAAAIRLARLEPDSLPVISLYLNLQADQHGKDSYAAFVRKQLPLRAGTLEAHSAARDSVDRDIQRIEDYLATKLSPSANGVAIFACAGRDGFFEALQLDAAIEQHHLSVSPAPHLYPLERLIDQHPPHAVVMADSHVARLYVFGLGRTLEAQTVEGARISHTAVGGWSQMRYQRHTEKLRADHVRELVTTLDRIVRDEGIAHVVLVGDEVNIPLIKAELSKELAAKVIDVLKLE